MSTTCRKVPTGKQICKQWGLEKDLFDWGVLPEHQAMVMGAVNKHLMGIHELHSAVDITLDSAFPGNADEVDWVKDNPLLDSSDDLGDYIHIWAHPTTGQLLIIVLRPDLDAYPEDQSFSESGPFNGPNDPEIWH